MKGNKREPERITDNYAQFIEQLNAASKNLSARCESLSKTLEVLVLLIRQNEAGLHMWEDRRNSVSKLISPEAKSATNLDALHELHEVARRMELMFLNRTQRIVEKHTAIQDRFDEINVSLDDLDRSRLKLASSRMLSLDRENLNRAVADLEGTPRGATTGTADLGLREDLYEARRAIILAEALLELKGN